VFIGAVEAGAEHSWYMKSITDHVIVRAAAGTLLHLQRAADIFSNDSDRGLGGLYGQDLGMVVLCRNRYQKVMGG
jgi:hypothetical protein